MSHVSLSTYRKEFPVEIPYSPITVAPRIDKIKNVSKRSISSGSSSIKIPEKQNTFQCTLEKNTADFHHKKPDIMTLTHTSVMSLPDLIQAHTAFSDDENPPTQQILPDAPAMSLPSTHIGILSLDKSKEKSSKAYKEVLDSNHNLLSN